jgi:hypothetical protein
MIPPLQCNSPLHRGIGIAQYAFYYEAVRSPL